MALRIGVNIHDVKEVKFLDEKLKRETPIDGQPAHFWVTTLAIISNDEGTPPVIFHLFNSEGYRIKGPAQGHKVGTPKAIEVSDNDEVFCNDCGELIDSAADGCQSAAGIGPLNTANSTAKGCKGWHGYR